MSGDTAFRIKLTAGIRTGTKSDAPARALIAFLVSPAADSTLQQKGMERAY